MSVVRRPMRKRRSRGVSGRVSKSKGECKVRRIERVRVNRIRERSEREEGEGKRMKKTNNYGKMKGLDEGKLGQV